MMNMRLVFIDIHTNFFLIRNFKMIIYGSKVVTYKHKFILDYAFNNNIEICSLITGLKSTMPIYQRIVPKDKYKIGAKFEMNYVLKKNALEKNIKIIDVCDIRKDDIVVAYLYQAYQLDLIKKFDCIKVLMGNHFVSINNPINLSEIGVNAFVNEIDLGQNDFVRKFINTIGVKAIACPYIFADRFYNKNKKRLNKIMAIGTLSTCKGHSDYKLYREFFKTEWIQPLRKMIFDRANDYPKEIDSYISYILEDKKQINRTDNRFIKNVKKIKNRFTPMTQSKYTSFDMVEKFNEYKMFICPEELVGFPGIGFVEGMACGTAYVGLDAYYYRQLGLVPGIHYISYDGTMEDLVAKVRYYQLHTEELDTIARTGETFIRNNFNTKIVAERFFADLEKLLNLETKNQDLSHGQ